jgi:hypothetical protein
LDRDPSYEVEALKDEAELVSSNRCQLIFSDHAYVSGEEQEPSLCGPVQAADDV